MTGTGVLLSGMVPTDGDYSDVNSWRLPVVLMLPLLSFCVALWTRHTDAIIGFLSAYCQHFERLDDPHQTSWIPGWHDTRYKVIDKALNVRVYSDLAVSMIVFVATLPSVVKLYVYLSAISETQVPAFRGGSSHPTATWIFIAVLFLVGFLLGLSAIILTIGNATNRSHIKNDWVYGRYGASGKSQWGWSDDPELTPFYSPSTYKPQRKP